MKTNIYRSLCIVAFVMSLISSCKKSDSSSGSTTTTADLIKDSALLYSRDIYLWYSQIPSTFNARSYSGPDSIMSAIRKYSIEPGFSQPVDRFSFAMKQVDWNNLSNGVSADFGLSVFFFVEGDLRVKSVERESSAGKAGIKRGWRVTKLNGSTNITTSNSDFIVQNVFYSSHSTFTFLKPDGTSVDIALDASSYNTHPVVKDSVYTISTKKIGYMVFSSFLGDTVEIANEFNRVFNRFATAGVNDVVIDLRYNGGGYVSVAQKLSNYLTPGSANGSLMMSQKYNDRYTQYNTSANFSKAGSVNLSRVFFIVSSSSASASELVINNLTPVMDVKLVGRNNTYGKPVAFFPIPDGDWYIFPVSIRSTNKNGDGNYFNGFTPNSIVADGVDKDWGDVTETSLASAIKYITTGSFRVQASDIYQQAPEVQAGNNLLDKNTFKGTIVSSKFQK